MSIITQKGISSFHFCGVSVYETGDLAAELGGDADASTTYIETLDKDP